MPVPPSGLRFRPATAAELDAHPELFPEVGAGFEAIGFERAGALVEDLSPAGLDHLVAGYDATAEAGFRRWVGVPATALASPDGTTLLLIGWFWDTPAVELASILAEGRPVLTRAPWQVDPPWPIALQRYWKFTDRRTEQLYDDVPGRSIEIVGSQDPASLWAAHQAHLGRVGTPRAITVETYCDMRNVMHGVNLRTTDRMNKLGGALVAAACVLSLFVGVVAGVALDRGWLSLAVGLVCLVGLLPLVSRLSWVLRHQRRLRVRYPLPSVT